MIFRSLYRKSAVLLIVTSLLGFLVGCTSKSGGAGPSAKAGAIDVVAADNFWGNIIGQIGGDYVHVTSIRTNPSYDPHQAEADAKANALVSKARLLVLNGLGYDQFLVDAIQASEASSRKTVSVDKILHRSGDQANPHLWYDIAALGTVADAFAQALSEIDQAHSAEFLVKAKEFTTSLKSVSDVIAKIRAKYAGISVAYTERVAGYLVDSAGLKLGIPESYPRAVEDESSPSAADTAAFNAALTNKTVKVLIYNSQVTSAVTTQAKELASRAGVPIVGVTESLPSTDKDFQSWQLRQATELLTALGG
jgi:zinc/manganese transport system substrate-binding protein